MKLVVEEFENAIADEDEEIRVRLRDGFRSAPHSNRGSEDEDEEENADVLVAQEIEKRHAKEGSVFLMTLFGHPALILV
jgi:hypothetical protein